MALTDDQIDLYSRQIILRELGGVGQKKLQGARCLLMGNGPAFEAAATYLVGAGVGCVDLARRGTDASVAFAPVETRNPDVQPGEAEAPEVSTYDVLVDATGIGAGPAPSGCARLGEIAIYGGPAGICVDVIPSASGCLSCHPVEHPLQPTAAIDALQAGSLGALAALLWLAEIRPDGGPKRMTLAHGAPIWTETPLGPTATCPRPCRL